MPHLRWCPACRRAAAPDEVVAEVVGWPGDRVLRCHVDEVCPRCGRVLHEHVSGPAARHWATAQAVGLVFV